MARQIFVLDDKKNLTSLSATDYDSEALLQSLLEDHSELLGGDQMNEAAPRHWLLIDRECGIPNEEEGGNWWSLDHLFLDQDAIPTLVEVKRSSDTRIRREVVGQMLDYAANLVAYLPVEKLRSRFEKRFATEELAHEAFADFRSDDPSADYEGFWDEVKTNLQAGRLRLLFVADAIPPELRRVVEFLNEQMSTTEVLAIEIKQYSGEGLKTLVPRVLGQTASTQVKRDRPGKKWDAPSLFAELQRRVPAAVDPARKILAWAEAAMPDIYWGKGANSGSFFPGMRQDGVWQNAIAVWTNGSVEIQFQHMARKVPFEDEALRREMLEKLNAIPGVSLSEDRLDKRPSFPLELLVDFGAMKLFLEVLDWFVAKLKESETEPLPRQQS